MRVYEVQPGDSPASIAAQDSMAGCPKCSVDLIHVNPHKETVTFPNGFVSFKELRVGEKLNLPDRWFDGTLDNLPQSYFAALPYADGVTPGRGTGVGLAAPFSERLIAAARAADASLDVDYYCDEVARVGSPTNAAVHNFKAVWNAEQTPPVPINTGNYELPTAEALYQVLGAAFEPCATRSAAPRVTKPAATPARMSTITPKKEGISAGQVVGVALVGAGAVAAAIYLVTK